VLEEVTLVVWGAVIAFYSGYQRGNVEFAGAWEVLVLAAVMVFAEFLGDDRVVVIWLLVLCFGFAVLVCRDGINLGGTSVVLLLAYCSSFRKFFLL